MNYLRNVVSDVKLKYRAGRVVYDCITKREQPDFPHFLTECVGIADGHPELVLNTMHEYLSFRQPEIAYGALLLLEQLVSLCNYGFHLALAKDYEVQDRIIQLAVKRGEGEAHRKAQRLARLTLLEYSRVFVDDRELLRLSSLASSFEHRTRKNLLRCLNVQNRRVRFRDVDKSDIIPISPKESLGSTTASAPREVTPLRLSSAPEVWPCHVCTYLNAPSATRCAACETLRSVDSISHRATPQHTPKTTPKIAPQPSPPPPQPELTSEDSPSSPKDESQGIMRNGVTSSTQWHDEADLSLPPSSTNAAVLHAGPPPAAVYEDPVHLDEEEIVTQGERDEQQQKQQLQQQQQQQQQEEKQEPAHLVVGTGELKENEEKAADDGSPQRGADAQFSVAPDQHVDANVSDPAGPFATATAATTAASMPMDASRNFGLETPSPHSPATFV